MEYLYWHRDKDYNGIPPLILLQFLIVWLILKINFPQLRRLLLKNFKLRIYWVYQKKLHQNKMMINFILVKLQYRYSFYEIISDFDIF